MTEIHDYRFSYIYRCFVLYLQNTILIKYFFIDQMLDRRLKGNQISSDILPQLQNLAILRENVAQIRYEK